MTTRVLKTVVCDRCGAEADEEVALFEWGRLRAVSVGTEQYDQASDKVVGTPYFEISVHGPEGIRSDADICPDCVSTLREWWERKE